jgi:hypothetical protein
MGRTASLGRSEEPFAYKHELQQQLARETEAVKRQVVRLIEALHPPRAASAGALALERLPSVVAELPLAELKGRARHLGVAAAQLRALADSDLGSLLGLVTGFGLDPERIFHHVSLEQFSAV